MLRYQGVRGGFSSVAQEPIDRDAGGLDDLLPVVYEELHRLAAHYFRHQRPGHTLQTTALVHEAYLKLSGTAEPHWQDRRHFYCLAAKAMRQILINHERDRKRLKRGGDWQRIPLDGVLNTPAAAPPDLEALDEALERLAKLDARKSQIVELRYFGGFSVEETADILQISVATVKRDWTLAKAWLLEALTADGTDDAG